MIEGMEINVKMTAQTFEDFVAYSKDKEKYKKELKKVAGWPRAMAKILSFAVEPVEGKPGKFKIVSQEHMADLWDMATDIEEAADGATQV